MRWFRLRRHRSREIDRQAEDLRRRLIEHDGLREQEAQRERDVMARRVRYLEVQAEVLARRHLSKFAGEEKG